jgi:hypothetical protein
LIITANAAVCRSLRAVIDQLDVRRAQVGSARRATITWMTATADGVTSQPLR